MEENKLTLSDTTSVISNTTSTPGMEAVLDSTITRTVESIKNLEMDEKSFENCNCENNIPLFCCKQCQKTVGIKINRSKLSNLFIKWLKKSFG